MLIKSENKMKFQDWESAEKVPFNLDGRTMYSEKNIELVHLKLKPGESLELHKNPFDVVFYILKGSGVLTVDQKSKEFNSFASIEVKSTSLRAWENKSNSDFEVLVIKLLS